jgi:hypothetical protein
MIDKQLIEQLAAAMDKHPGRCILDIIKDACDYTYPTRTDKSFNIIKDVEYVEHWKLDNQDILKSLIVYNRK